MTVQEKNDFLKQNEKTTCLLHEFHDDSLNNYYSPKLANVLLVIFIFICACIISYACIYFNATNQIHSYIIFV